MLLIWSELSQNNHFQNIDKLIHFDNRIKFKIVTILTILEYLFRTVKVKFWVVNLKSRGVCYNRKWYFKSCKKSLWLIQRSHKTVSFLHFICKSILKNSWDVQITRLWPEMGTKFDNIARYFVWKVLKHVQHSYFFFVIFGKF